MDAQELRARDLEVGMRYREFGMDDQFWTIDAIAHDGDIVVVMDREEGRSVWMDGDEVVEVRS